jgi:hypothetical protein
MAVVQIGHQKAVLGGLQGYAAALAGRGGEVGHYVGDLAQRQANLGQRLALLQQMHWALPRPPSEAEAALLEQLVVSDAGEGGGGCMDEALGGPRERNVLRLQV